jgi:hypothetical protein
MHGQFFPCIHLIFGVSERHSFYLARTTVELDRVHWLVLRYSGTHFLCHCETVDPLSAEPSPGR